MGNGLCIDAALPLTQIGVLTAAGTSNVSERPLSGGPITKYART
jgi:hypothetical protein